MNQFLTGVAAGLLVLAGAASAKAATTFFGPSAYVSAADAPVSASSFANYYLEDVEDNLINTLGLTVTGPSLCIAGFNCFVNTGLTDSVGNGGNGNLGRSSWSAGSATVSFGAVALGSLPTFAGLVWTDGAGSIRFEAFDANGVSLGVLVGNHADGSHAGTLADDRFYGVSHSGGISRLLISNSAGGTEIDHIQYGVGSRGGVVPEPATWAMMLVGFGFAGALIRRRRLAAA